MWWMKAPVRLLALTAVLIALLTFFTIQPTWARYNNTTRVSVIYGSEKEMEQTLSENPAVYDFGCWTREVSEEFESTILLKSETSLEGTLRLELDSFSRTNAEISVWVDPQQYVSAHTGGYTDYTIFAPDGRLEFPFALIFSSNPTTGRVATLDVSWYPSGSDRATLFARYLLTLDPVQPTTTDSTFLRDDTCFMAKDMVQVSVNTPSECDGVVLGCGTDLSSAFAKGTRYFTPQYPNGVTLLRESVVYLPRQADVSSVTVDFSAVSLEKSDLSITAGLSSDACNTLALSAADIAAPFALSASNPAMIVSQAQPLALDLSMTSALTDAAWNSAGTGAAEFTWRVQHLSEGVFTDVVLDEHLTVTTSQTAEGGTLTVSAPTGECPAGTYRLVFSLTHNGYELVHSTTWFFVDYR